VRRDRPRGDLALVGEPVPGLQARLIWPPSRLGQHVAPELGDRPLDVGRADRLDGCCQGRSGLRPPSGQVRPVWACLPRAGPASTPPPPAGGRPGWPAGRQPPSRRGCRAPARARSGKWSACPARVACATNSAKEPRLGSDAVMLEPLSQSTPKQPTVQGGERQGTDAGRNTSLFEKPGARRSDLCPPKGERHLRHSWAAAGEDDQGQAKMYRAS